MCRYAPVSFCHTELSSSERHDFPEQSSRHVRVPPPLMHLL